MFRGLKQGLFSSLITFGTLKGFGKLAEGQNALVQHGAQDLGMVLGHDLIYHLGSYGNISLYEKPEGSFAEKLFYAEITNLQLGAGMALGHSLTGGKYSGLENALSPVIRPKEIFIVEKNARPREKTQSLLRNPLFYPLWSFLGAEGAGCPPNNIKTNPF
jgi:hypothetical protein